MHHAKRAVCKRCTVQRQHNTHLAVHLHRRVSTFALSNRSYTTVPVLMNGLLFHCSFHYGNLCQHTDICATESPCDRGSCEPIEGTYTCTCDTGFTDVNCTVELFCVTQNVTCQNGVTCEEVEGRFSERKLAKHSIT